MSNNHLSTKEADSKRSMYNGKPYRSKTLKELARKQAYKGTDGAYHSAVEVLFHPKPKE
jgi:hypothetical protein